MSVLRHSDRCIHGYVPMGDFEKAVSRIEQVEMDRDSWKALAEEMTTQRDQLRGAVQAERERIASWLIRRAENVGDSGAHLALTYAARDLRAWGQ